MSLVHRCMIVPLSQAASARDMAANLAGPAGSNMWLTGLSSNGQAPATHYISSGLIDDPFAALMADANMLYGACQQAGLAYTLAQCQAVLAASDVSGDDPFAAMARLGLQLVQEAQ